MTADELKTVIETRLNTLQGLRQEYNTRRQAEGWSGYDLLEAEEVNGLSAGYVTALQDVIKFIQTGGDAASVFCLSQDDLPLDEK